MESKEKQIKKLYYVISHNSDHADVVHYEASNINDVYRQVWKNYFSSFLSSVKDGHCFREDELKGIIKTYNPEILEMEEEEMEDQVDFNRFSDQDIRMIINSCTHDGDSSSAYVIGAVNPFEC